MGLFGPRRVTCPAGRWTTIISTSFAQMPKPFDVRFEGEAAGEFEETKSSWIFPGKPQRGALAPKLTFSRGYWNTFYKVRVLPQHEVIAEIQ
jgi:hypothetical protein